ncbi:C-Myc-binding protein-like [Varroa jacobsoni]|uniref:Uncharacterized protein n=1 Tax=Varroa destructor TaxID=109461 RepID=A0A7M7JM98_VARDE|nr:C-Myc-binding protein-like [Varroa destructor]XP_022654314.1 C-Myc-binding protein-like [Varroa destructor]XP_022654315.1 C-Myc-binding protein-like [Varroa destructor]XP_022700837.1 C-Myc-binding protein-like [Varroa jacobsoni]
MESKREEFRKYLEKGGALQALSCALSHLYEMPEKPSDPLLFIQERLKQCVEGGKLSEVPPAPPTEPIDQTEAQSGSRDSGLIDNSVNTQ